MKIIFRYLRPFAAGVVLSLILLFGQALCDLSLPNLMSDIINIGIQDSGIVENAPSAISKNGMGLLKLFMKDNDKKNMDDAYTLVESGSAKAADYIGKYPLLASSDIYVRNSTDSKDPELAKLYGKSVLAFMNAMKSMMPSGGSSAGMAGGINSETGFSDVNMTEVYPLLSKLAMMPPETLAPYIDGASESDSMLTEQVGTTFTKLFYKELGMDLNALQRNYILMTGIKMLLVALAGVAAAILVGFLSSRIAASLARKMRHDVFKKVESFSNAEFDKFSTASLITRTTNDVQQVQMLVVMGIRMMCYAPIMGIGGIIMAVNESVSLSWIIAAAVIALIGLIMVIFSIALPKFKSLQKLLDRLNLVSRENLSGMMVIRAFNNEEYEEKRFEGANRDLSNTNLFVQRLIAFAFPAIMLIMNLATLAIVWFGSNAIADSNLQIGDMMAFMQYAMQIIMSFIMIAMMFIMVPRASVSADRIGEVLDTALTISDPAQTKTMGSVKGRIEFKDVSFRYHNAETDVLQNISFTAKPGETTAIIGPTGSGKSTLINLIPRFYDVTGGVILIDGTDIRDVSQHELRDNIGFVPQKGLLFSGDIESNIRYGKEDASAEELRKALEVAQVNDFVESTEEGISTSIAQGGGNVSGGQRQRLSIARALVKNPPIYIFDDSFSALDFKTDALLRKALKQHTRDAAVLIVAQRVSTIMNAEQIIVLDAGRIAGIGTHAELLQTCGEYREIAESQLSKEELA